MWDISRLYLLACSNPVQLVPIQPIQPIIMSILLYHYKELIQCISEFERIEAKVNSKNKEWSSTMKKEEVKKEEEKREWNLIALCISLYVLSILSY